MKQQYQTRYEWLHESYQKWLTGFMAVHNMCVPASVWAATTI